MCLDGKKADNVFVGADAEKLRIIFLAPESAFPFIINTPVEANIGKSVDVAILVPMRVHSPINMLLVCNSVFVRGSLRSKPLGASVTGSWSKRGMFGESTSMRPWELTNVAKEARVNVETGNETGAGAMNGILLEMEVVNSIWVI